MVSDSSREPDVLAERYGRSPGTHRREKRLGIIVAAAFAVVLVAWVTWASLDAAGSSLETRDVAHSIVSDTSVDVTFQLTVEPESTTYCAVQALNERFAVVGWKIIEVPPSEMRTRTLTEGLRTTELANTGLIYRCWLA